MIYQFNQVTIDTERFRLTLLDELVSVEPLVFDLLVYLIEHRDRVVTRDELLDNLWHGKVVTDTALGVRIKDVRKAVQDNGAKQEVIKTFHGRGYQFIAEVTESPENKSNTLKGKSTATQKALSLPDIPSIAVLPFTNMSGDAQQEYFVDGMTDEIITGLSRVPGLFVVASNSTMVYKGRAVDIKEVGREQGVRYVLEGSFRKVGNQIRVSAQLIDAVSGLHVWAERYQKKLDDIFAVQDDIAHAVVVELQVKLLTGEHSRLWATGTNSVEAWELLIRSRELLISLVRDDALIARQLLKQALDLDEDYSAAWALLGWTYWQESVWNWCTEPEKSMQKAFDAAQKSLESDLLYPDGFSLLGHIYMIRGETAQAIENNERAVELAPSDSRVTALLGNVLIDSGRIKEGIQKMLRAIRLCPIPPAWYLMVLGSGYHLNEDNENAISTLEQAVEGMPDSIFPLLWLASTLVEKGRLDEARVISGSVLDIKPDFSAKEWANSFRSSSHARLKSNLFTAGFTE